MFKVSRITHLSYDNEETKENQIREILNIANKFHFELKYLGMQSIERPGFNIEDLESISNQYFKPEDLNK